MRLLGPPTSPNKALRNLSLLIEGSFTPPRFLQIHALLLKSAFFLDPFIAGLFLRRCLSVLSPQSLLYCRSVFDSLPCPDIFSWNSLLRAYLRSRSPKESLGVYQKLRRTHIAVDSFSLSLALQASGKSCERSSGMCVHAHVVKHGFCSDLFVQTALVEMYAKLREVVLARKVFDEMSVRDVTSYNVMLMGYVEIGDLVLARRLFDAMSVRDLYSWNTMIHGYASSGDLGSAREMFDGSKERDLVSWSSMISGYAKVRKPNEALRLFGEMQSAGVFPDCVTLVSVLSACGDVGALDMGKTINKFIEKNSIVVDLKLGTSLVDMYSKCGDIKSALELFDGMSEKDVQTWTTMISGLANHGQGKTALWFFENMKMHGVKPNDITFVGVLSACGHTGLVKDGWAHFKSMSEYYGLSPKIEHYGCMVDLLGKAGRAEEARMLVREMPFEPDAVIWRALLGACQLHRNPDLAEEATIKLIELEPDVDGHYVLLSNMYAKAKRWGEVASVRKKMRCQSIRRVPGCSSIEVGNQVHEFVAGDRTHPRSEDILRMLEEMLERLKQRGYRPMTYLVLQDVDKRTKERALAQHSEKLAVAFGLLSSPPKTCIRVVKNLRVCEDCHSFIKLISLVYEREMIIRDRNRFHHSARGECSCRDYW